MDPFARMMAQRLDMLTLAAHRRDAAIRSVRSIDLRRVRERVATEYAMWDQERLDAAFAQYDRFLTLCVLYPDEELMPLSADMDQVWHFHILHTEQYAADCTLLFGEFLHHEPASTPYPPAELRENTHSLYRAVFGIDPPAEDGFCIAPGR